MTSRTFIAALAALVLGVAGFAAAADMPALTAADWEVGPEANSDGRQLGVEWKSQPAEEAYFKALDAAVKAKKEADGLAKDGKPVPADLAERAKLPTAPTYEYVILLAGSADGPFTEIAKIPAINAWKKDNAEIFGNSALDAPGHFQAIELLSIVSPDQLATAAWKPEAPERKRVADLLGHRTIDDAKELLESRGIAPGEDLTDVAAYGYFGNGGLAGLVLHRDWRVKLAVREGDLVAYAGEKTARPRGSPFHTARLNNLVFMLLLAGLVVGFIQHARKNPNLFLRRIGGLDAVDEALGRATEMGKPVLFVHGLRTMSDISTIAAVNILGEIAKKVARYDSKLICVNNEPIVLAVSQETVKEAYVHSGRPDAYNPDDVYFLAAEQFSYVAAVDGIMVRQKPAANFYCGYFYAESLLLSETGATTGAIQIAATDSYTQLPFFVTTCDYTLMGEELYAASAYLSRDPMLLGSLKGQDVGKALLIAVILAGTALASIGVGWITNLLKAY